MHELLSAPVIKKFLASGSAGGNVSGGAVASGDGWPVSASVATGPGAAACEGSMIEGSMIAGAMLRSSITRWPAYNAPAAPNEPIAITNTAATVSRWGQVRGIRFAEVGVSVGRGGVGGGGTVTFGAGSFDGSFGSGARSGVGSDAISGVDSGSDVSDMTA